MKKEIILFGMEKKKASFPSTCTLLFYESLKNTLAVK